VASPFYILHSHFTESMALIVIPMTKTLSVYVSLQSSLITSGKKWGTVITLNATNAWCSFEIHCAFLQHSSSSVYPGFFKTPQIGVGPHDNPIEERQLAGRKDTWHLVHSKYQLSWIGHSATLRVIAILQQNYRANIYTVDYDANPNL
jgi:hypothetical protein